MHYVYVIKCRDDTTYVGCTNDFDRRLIEHQNGEVESTKNKRPIELICYTAFQNKYLAYNFEKYLKSGSGRAFLGKHFIED
ncbi:MAG: GIY-YIG nuclease family protein [bacterium]|nr:GIY-YIG nuclease family protein [bacterium]